jgi:hypothetical protein
MDRPDEGRDGIDESAGQPSAESRCALLAGLVVFVLLFQWGGGRASAHNVWHVRLVDGAVRRMAGRGGWRLDGRGCVVGALVAGPPG